MSTITRIDITKSPVAVVIRCWADGWTASSALADYQEHPADYDIERLLGWLEQHGWTVRRYPWTNVARAWKGEPLPVRDNVGINRLRRRLTEEAQRNGGLHPRGIPLHSLDLRYDL